MKRRWLRISFLVLLIGIFLASLGGCLLKVEKVGYEVIRSESPFQVRHYPSYLVAETVIDASMEQAGNIAFRPLFAYISGKNSSTSKIEMTTPVSQEATSQKIAMTAPVEQTRSGNSWKVSFAMPASFTMESLPTPMDNKVIIREVEEHQVVSIKYSGNWTQSRYSQHLAKLREWMTKEGMSAVGEPVWARYDAPFMPSFLRRNEIMIPINPK